MKISKWLCTLLCAVLLCAMPMTAFAAELDENSPSGSAVISAQVPSSHTLTVNADGASVFADNTIVDGTASLARQSTPTLLIRAESGRKLQAVTLDGIDITNKLKNGRFTLPKVITAHTLTVTTVEETIPSAVTYTVTGTVKQNGKPVSGITLELRSELKTFVTGSDGTFRFEKVESGHHSLTALKDGKVVGYAEFTLSDGSVELNYSVAEDGTVNITVPENTAAINLDINLTDDGILQIADVQAIKGTTPGGNSPQTGDTTNIYFWLIILCVSGLVVVTLSTKKNDRRKNNNGNIKGL